MRRKGPEGGTRAAVAEHINALHRTDLKRHYEYPGDMIEAIKVINQLTRTLHLWISVATMGWIVAILLTIYIATT